MDVISIEKTNENFRLSTTLKVDSSCTESPPKKLPTNSAESRKCSLKRTTFHSWSHTTDDPSDTQTQTAKSVIPSNSTLPPARSPTGSNSIPVTYAKSSAARMSVEWVPSSPENDTPVPSISSTSKTLPDTFSPPEPPTSFFSEKVTKLLSAPHEKKVSERPSPKNEMLEWPECKFNFCSIKTLISLTFQRLTSQVLA